jgi:hypothetical protein
MQFWCCKYVCAVDVCVYSGGGVGVDRVCVFVWEEASNEKKIKSLVGMVTGLVVVVVVVIYCVKKVKKYIYVPKKKKFKFLVALFARCFCVCACYGGDNPSWSSTTEFRSRSKALYNTKNNIY